MFILIAYDIADATRLKKVAKLMEAYGRRIQKSVFECVIDDDQLRIVMHEAKHLMKRSEDRVQLYHLCSGCQHKINAASEVSFAAEAVYVC